MFITLMTFIIVILTKQSTCQFNISSTISSNESSSKLTFPLNTEINLNNTFKSELFSPFQLCFCSPCLNLLTNTIILQGIQGQLAVIRPALGGVILIQTGSTGQATSATSVRPSTNGNSMTNQGNMAGSSNTMGSGRPGAPTGNMGSMNGMNPMDGSGNMANMGSSNSASGSTGTMSTRPGATTVNQNSASSQSANRPMTLGFPSRPSSSNSNQPRTMTNPINQINRFTSISSVGSRPISNSGSINGQSLTRNQGSGFWSSSDNPGQNEFSIRPMGNSGSMNGQNQVLRQSFDIPSISLSPSGYVPFLSNERPQSRSEMKNIYVNPNRSVPNQEVYLKLLQRKDRRRRILRPNVTRIAVRSRKTGSRRPKVVKIAKRNNSQSRQKRPNPSAKPKNHRSTQ